MANSAKELESASRTRRNVANNADLIEIQIQYQAAGDLTLYRGETVLDSFVGRGTTVLSALRTGRMCRGIELDPLKIDAAIRRWQNPTGRDAVRTSDARLFREIEMEKGAKR